MNGIDDIKKYIKIELEHFNEVFNSAFSVEEELLKKSLVHVSMQKGKQVRPIFIILFAKLCGLISEKTYNGAAAIEMFHTASLLHDDVVDETKQRRGLPSLNAVFDNKTAVLVGDYLLTKSMHFMVNTCSLEMIHNITNMGKEITRGELLQIQRAYSLPSEEQYLEIIQLKTAALFSICASVAAISSDATSEKRNVLEKFGLYIGTAFQIKDDILDYTKDAVIGKPIFNDIREGKITLPLLYTLKMMDENKRNQIMTLIRNGEFTDDLIEDINSEIKQHKGIEYAVSKMESFHNEAVDLLSIFPDSIEKNALIALANYVLNRKL